MTEAEFVRTYGEQVPCIYRYCQFRTNSRSDAEDLTVVDDPGEWWPVHKVDGLWKTQWMPRQ
jgi:hypothetical protein